jgi:hypothetical protein
MAIADRRGLPVAVHIESATPHEVTLVHATLAQRFVKPLPVRFIGDNAYESDRLDADLARRGVELMAPHRRTRTSRTQDGRPLRRYRRRWKIERLFAWFQNFRRLVQTEDLGMPKFLPALPKPAQDRLEVMVEPSSCSPGIVVVLVVWLTGAKNHGDVERYAISYPRRPRRSASREPDPRLVISIRVFELLSI